MSTSIILLIPIDFLQMSFCGAIEIVRNGHRHKLLPWKMNFFFLQAGIITCSTSVIKGGIEKFALKQPIFLVCSAFLGCVTSGNY